MNDLPLNDLPLHDIHLPDAVSWWPLATGWWILLVTLLVIVLSAYLFLKYKKNRTVKIAYQKIALNELKELQQQSKHTGASIELLRAISSLLRRIALSYLPRETVASLTGTQWIEQLNKLTSKPVFSTELSQLLASAPYQQHADYDSQKLLDTCEMWIRQLPQYADKQAYSEAQTK